MTVSQQSVLFCSVLFRSVLAVVLLRSTVDENDSSLAASQAELTSDCLRAIRRLDSELAGYCVLHVQSKDQHTVKRGALVVWMTTTLMTLIVVTSMLAADVQNSLQRR